MAVQTVHQMAVQTADLKAGRKVGHWVVPKERCSEHLMGVQKVDH